MTEQEAPGPQERSRAALLSSLPPEWPHDPLPAIRAAARARGETVVALDDDPTGTQTVHDVAVLTAWPTAALHRELAAAPPALYLLTNTRSRPDEEAAEMNRRAGRALEEAGRASGRRIVAVSRSDSTLRGHFPGEVDALAAGLGGVDATLLIPAFIAGGRYTIGDVHYVAEGDRLMPAGETPFARDASFGYRCSDLRAWVEEKTGGRIPATRVASLSIETIRAGGPERVAASLLALAPGGVCVVNAASERDLAVVACGAQQAEAAGRRLLYRTAASFVPLRAGLAPRPLLTAADLALEETGGSGRHGAAGGLIVVGSHVPSTSAQVEILVARTGLARLDLDVRAALAGRGDAEAARVAATATALLARGEDIAIVTERALAVGADPAESLTIARRVSLAVVAVVRGVGVRPRYLLAKGGITASDVATEALGVRRAVVQGQIAAGIPVWRLGAESRHPGLPYIVFPGNVGGPDALADVVAALRRAEGERPAAC